MIYRLTYCNKDGVTARLDIIKGASKPVEVIEGTENPFLLSYELDSSDKSGFFMTSVADISIYESGTFNIDNLKTSSETELKVEYYINETLFWTGFIIPDFFNRNIGSPATVEMVASGRLGTLKSSTLSDLTQYVSMRELAAECLSRTGLSLPLYTMADFGNSGQTNAFFKALALSERLSDTKGRNISCYDILRSILVACDGKIVQQGGAWYIVNKLQHEQGSGNLFSTLTTSTPYAENTVPFSEVNVGARRTIVPVAATTGVYHEHGGGRKYPENYDFSQGTAGWLASGGFSVSVENRDVLSYERIDNIWTVNYGSAARNKLVINNIWPGPYSDLDLIPYAYSTFPVITTNKQSVNVAINLSVTGLPFLSTARIAIFAEKGEERLAFSQADGAFVTYDSSEYGAQGESTALIRIKFPFTEMDEDKMLYSASTSSILYNTRIEAADMEGWTISVRFYGTTGYNGRVIPVFVNFAHVTFSNTDEMPKGTIYKRNQGAGFTKEHPTDTSIFGDYITTGLNGYFYNYSIDDTSSLFSSPNILTLPEWTSFNDSARLPLLQHVTRQRSRMFSVAHNIITAVIDVDTFRPLSIFVDCNSRRYVVVSARFDFFRSTVEVSIEEIAYSSLNVQEFIYSYFGEGETGISSIGGISSGTGTGGGTGMTPEQIAILSDVEDMAHVHDNKAILDEVTQDVIDNSHYHNNKAILDDITQEVIDNALREMVTEFSTTPLTDENYLSSLRTIKEITERAISKVNPDTAQGLIQFLKGLEVGKYLPGLLGSGGKIDEFGHGELRSLRLWESLEVPELRFNRVIIYTGVHWQTFGGGIIEDVEIDKDTSGNELQSGIITLKLEDGEVGAVAVDDMCQGIYHNFGGTNDTIEEDQRNGNFHMKGFNTSYFRITEILDTGTNKRFRYVLRGISPLWNQLNHPKPFMHFACYANPTNPDRQACSYSTTEYSIRLRNMTTWEYGEANIYAIEGKLDGFSLGDNVFSGTGQVIGNGYFYGYIQTINIPDIVQDEIDSIKEDTKNINTTFFSKPDKYKKGDSWVLLEDTVLNNVYYEKGQVLQAVYETGTDSDWRLVQLEDEAKTTDGVNLIRNYDLRYGLTHWGGVGEIGELTEADVIPTEFYEPTINVLGDEYGYEYGITTDEDELIIMDE